MKVALVPNHTTLSQETARILTEKLKAADFEFDDKQPDVVISIGGDGTLLSAFHQYETRVDKSRFIGIHTGHLGFYTDWLASELDEFVAQLLVDTNDKVTYPLLSMTVTNHDGSREHYLALNEAAIKQPEGTLVADIYLGDNAQIFERFRGDGLAIATPTGSTAYNKANGGAILHPHVRAIQMSEIASINNRVYRTLGSPLVVDRTQTIRIVPQSAEFMVTIDQLTFHAQQVKELTFQIATEEIAFVDGRHVDFWARVQNAFIGEIE
ncbi:MAG TPA: NAD kinase [Lactobacillaceae bacterium]|jgi:NAD+ kinase